MNGSGLPQPVAPVSGAGGCHPCKCFSVGAAGDPPIFEASTRFYGKGGPVGRLQRDVGYESNEVGHGKPEANHENRSFAPAIPEVRSLQPLRGQALFLACGP